MLQEGASVLMRCECFRYYHYQILDQIWTNFVIRVCLVRLYRWLLEFLYKQNRRCLSLMRRIVVLIVALLMESLVVFFLVLQLVLDWKMSAKLELRVVSDEWGKGVDQRLDFVMWRWFVILRSRSCRLRRCVSLYQWRLLDLMEGLDFDLEGCVYFCLQWRSSRKVALVWDPSLQEKKEGPTVVIWESLSEQERILAGRVEHDARLGRVVQV